MDIVIIPFHDYKKWINEGFRTRDAHLLQHFEKRSDVDKILVVNRPVSLAERVLKCHNWRTPFSNVIYKKNGVQLARASDKVWCLDIALKDFWKVAIQKKAWWFTAFKYKTVTDEINRAILYLEMNNSVLFLQNPMAIGAAENVDCSKFVFDAIDNWLYHPQMKDKNLIRKNYKYVEDNANLIFTVSEALTDMFSCNSNVHWVPNGVDVEYFIDAVRKQNSTDKVVVGYVGKIQERVDLDLVEACVKAFENVDFVFLGPIYSQKKRIKELVKTYKNIRFEGDIHYNKLPQAMRMFDIAIIPHKIDDFTNSMNPLKLYEYLASGKVVVTSSVAGTEDVSEFVLSSADRNGFISCLNRAISMVKQVDYDPHLVVNSVPSNCRWENRVDSILGFINCIK